MGWSRGVMGEHWGTSETDQPINLERMELEQNWRSTARDEADLEEMEDFGEISTRLQPACGPILLQVFVHSMTQGV